MRLDAVQRRAVAVALAAARTRARDLAAVAVVPSQVTAGVAEAVLSRGKAERLRLRSVNGRRRVLSVYEIDRKRGAGQKWVLRFKYQIPVEFQSKYR
jgi:hypothetical protein